LTCANTNIGGTGAGFTYLVTDVEANLDAEINMPPENEEPLHYNLALRICSAYQIEAQETTVKLARAGLNTLRQANIQIPTLKMPDGLRRGVSFNIYNADGY
jgi:hypothetical protein